MNDEQIDVQKRREKKKKKKRMEGHFIAKSKAYHLCAVTRVSMNLNPSNLGAN